MSLQDPSREPLSIRKRPRRLRRTPVIAKLVRQTRLHPSQLVLPVFVVEGTGIVDPIHAMPGCARRSIDALVMQCEEAFAIGIRAFALFPKIDDAKKDAQASEALNGDGLVCRTLRALRAELPDACVFSDVALDPFSSVGHDGLVSADGRILNDETVAVLADMAVIHAQAGADFVAPSDMMDGRIGAIRHALDEADCQDVGILSYCAKYASAFYGPFRDALDSAPAELPHVPSDKTTYQLDPANAREALREAALDEEEGADMLMVKPGLPYLDIIRRLSSSTSLPIAAYHVSGEYAMIRAAGERGWLDAEACMRESLVSLARAGARLIFTYAAVDYARWWRSEMA